MQLKLAAKNQPDILQQFYTSLREADLGLSADGYTGDVKRFLKWMADRHGAFAPQAVSTLDIMEYRTWMQTSGTNGIGLAPATVNRNLNSIKAFYRFCQETDIVQNNPARDVKLIANAKKPAPRWLTRNEQAALIRAVKEYGNLRDEAVIITLLHTGLRVSELAGLRRHNITIGPRSGLLSLIGKGNKHREVPLNSTVRKTLSQWLEKHTADDLFPGKKGALSSRSLWNIVDKYAYQARLEDVSPHTLRHTFCKNAVDMGISLEKVAMIAGHSSLDVTKIYIVPSVKDLQDAVEKMAWE
jgi:integrase/recombinase XerC